MRRIEQVGASPSGPFSPRREDLYARLETLTCSWGLQTKQRGDRDPAYSLFPWGQGTRFRSGEGSWFVITGRTPSSRNQAAHANPPDQPRGGQFRFASVSWSALRVQILRVTPAEAQSGIISKAEVCVLVVLFGWKQRLFWQGRGLSAQLEAFLEPGVG